MTTQSSDVDLANDPAPASDPSPETATPSPPPVPPESTGSKPSAGRKVLNAIIAILLLAGGAAVAYYWLKNPPTAERRSPRPEAVLVETTTVQPATHPMIVHALGTVVPARSIQLAARVSGQIVSVDDQFVPGGHFKAGKPILRIDPADYELAVAQRESELVRARSDLTIEMGQQSVAVQEAKLLGQSVKEEDQELILRKPQLAMARAAEASAKAALEKARLDLARTSIPAPFNAMVQTRNVNLGSQVSVGQTLATLVGMDEYWVQVSVGVDQLRWLDIPDGSSADGSEAKVFHETAWGEGVFRPGRVVRLMSGLETQGRMAQVLVSVPDPHMLSGGSQGRLPLLLDSYVRVEIHGRDVPDVVAVPRTAFREDKDAKNVWIMTPEGTLDIRPVTVAWTGPETVYISQGIEAGETLVVSDLGAPVQEMLLRTPDAASQPASKPESGQ